MTHGINQLHPVNQLHSILRPQWQNALWIVAVAFMVGFAYEGGYLFAIYLAGRL